MVPILAKWLVRGWKTHGYVILPNFREMWVVIGGIWTKTQKGVEICNLPFYIDHPSYRKWCLFRCHGYITCQNKVLCTHLCHCESKMFWKSSINRFPLLELPTDPKKEAPKAKVVPLDWFAMAQVNLTLMELHHEERSRLTYLVVQYFISWLNTCNCWWYDHASNQDVSSYNHLSFTYTDTSLSHRWTGYT